MTSPATGNQPPVNRSSGVYGPDFICVGLPKCGTGWLYDQLEAHPDFWMPPVKEILYLHEELPQLRFLQKRSRMALERVRANPKKRLGERVLRRKLDDSRDAGFVQYAASIQGQPRSLSHYAGLFSFKGNLLSGDISPPYWTLQEELIAEIAAFFPDLKILLLVRDPVARAWSRISVLHRSGKFDLAILEDETRFVEFLRTSPKVGGLFATKLAQAWLRHVTPERLHVLLFDEIVDDPGGARKDVLAFLGASSLESRPQLPAGYDRKADEKRLPLREHTEKMLARYFQEELLASAALFGGRALDWIDRHPR